MMRRRALARQRATPLFRGSMCASRRRNGPDEPCQQSADLDTAGPGRDHWIAGREGSEILLVLGLDDAEAPRAGAVEDRTEDNHPAGIDEGLPVLGMSFHDGAFVVGH